MLSEMSWPSAHAWGDLEGLVSNLAIATPAWLDGESAQQRHLRFFTSGCRLRRDYTRSYVRELLNV